MITGCITIKKVRKRALGKTDEETGGGEVTRRRDYPAVRVWKRNRNQLCDRDLSMKIRQTLRYTP